MPKKKSQPKQTLYKVVLTPVGNLTSADLEYWNNRIVTILSTKATMQESPIVGFRWGVFVTDGKEVFVVYHKELQPYGGNACLGRKDPDIEPDEFEEEFEEAIAH